MISEYMHFFPRGKYSVVGYTVRGDAQKRNIFLHKRILSYSSEMHKGLFKDFMTAQ